MLDNAGGCNDPYIVSFVSYCILWNITFYIKWKRIWYSNLTHRDAEVHVHTALTFDLLNQIMCNNYFALCAQTWALFIDNLSVQGLWHWLRIVSVCTQVNKFILRYCWLSRYGYHETWCCNWFDLITADFWLSSGRKDQYSNSCQERAKAFCTETILQMWGTAMHMLVICISNQHLTGYSLEKIIYCRSFEWMRF